MNYAAIVFYFSHVSPDARISAEGPVAYMH